MLKRRGIKHSVLNAKYHQQEAEIVSQAGQRGSVTIATNMAGRGTDIKLGKGVPGLGGLHILGTERHESRRIDRQLRGRSGRQGDPGSTRFYLSLEDDLMRLFGSERISGLMQRMGVQEGEVIEHPWVTGAIGRAQKRVEAHNFDIRKHLLEYDNVMNQQRTVIYEMRNKALMSEDMSEAVQDAIEEAVGDRVAKVTGGEQTHRDEWNFKGLADELSFLLMRPVSAPELETTDYAELEEKAVEAGVTAYRAREEEFSAPVLRDLERHLYLYTLDEHWRDHLYELDHLKGGIGLRAYGQRDPLIEYKKEAFTLFDTLLKEVNEDFVQRLFRVQLVPETMAEAERRSTRRRMVEHHDATAAFGGGAAGPESAPPAAARRSGAGEAPPAPTQPLRVGPRVGRNDPCPCGSGKKYKKCHMLIDQGVGSGT
jgi:preprotein translocase subunit SecA